MKKTNILFWTFTGLFAALMLLSSIPDILVTPEAKTFMDHLGYPDYFTRFIGVAKLLGIIAILIPGFPKIKEWAYAGMAFDLFGAIYSMVAVEGFAPGMTFMILPVSFLVLSYIYHHKKLLQK